MGRRRRHKGFQLTSEVSSHALNLVFPVEVHGEFDAKV